MKCAVTLAILGLCGLVGASAAAPALAARRQTLPLPATPHTVLEGRHGAGLALAPLSAQGGTGVVNGTVYAFDGSPMQGAQVYAGWRDGASFIALDPVTTDASGSYSVTGVPATTLGVVQAQLLSGNYFLRKGLAFADPGPSVFDLRPGRIHFTTTRATSGWGTWKSLAIYTSGSEGEARTISASTALSGSAWAMAPDVAYAVAYYWSNEAAEVRLPSAVAVTAGAAGRRKTVLVRGVTDAAARGLLRS